MVLSHGNRRAAYGHAGCCVVVAAGLIMRALPLFHDRQDAGLQLAAALRQRLHKDDVVVLALPRGGVPVGEEIARELNAPLDVLFVRKLGAPGYPELGVGAVVDGEHPQRILNQRVLDAVQPPPGYLEAEERRQLEVIEQRKRVFRHDRPPEPVEGRTAIVVDDGIATGGTVRVALQALAQSGAARLMLAVPVAPREVLPQLPVAPENTVCLYALPDFVAVGAYYRDFEQLDDDTVIALLDRAHRRVYGASGVARGTSPGRPGV
jgi:putative phosphoribosyl transferase